MADGWVEDGLEWDGGYGDAHTGVVLLFRKSSRPQAIHPLSGSTEVPPSTRRPPFILPWGWTARLYDLPPPLARLAHTEVVNLHPAALSAYLLCLSRSLPTLPPPSSSLFHLPLLLLSVLSRSSPPAPLPLPATYPRADTFNLARIPRMHHLFLIVCLTRTHATGGWIQTRITRASIAQVCAHHRVRTCPAYACIYIYIRSFVRGKDVIPSIPAVVPRPYTACPLFSFRHFQPRDRSRMVVVSRLNCCPEFL